jgi:hypothetical protein
MVAVVSGKLGTTATMKSVYARHVEPLCSPVEMSD